MTGPNTDPTTPAPELTALSDAIESIAWFRCEWASHPDISDEDRDFARQLVEWLEASEIAIVAAERPGVFRGTAKLRDEGRLKPLIAPDFPAERPAGTVTIDRTEAAKVAAMYYDGHWSSEQAARRAAQLLHKALAASSAEPDAALGQGESDG